MAEPDQYTLGELIRGLEGLRKDVADLIAEMKADRAENARTYVRADVYNVAQTAQNAIVADLHRDVGALDTNLRAKINADVIDVKNDTDARLAKVDAKFGAIENDKKVEVQWRRTLTLGLCGLGLTFVLTVAGFILNYATR